MEQNLTQQIEALLFAWGDALSYRRIGQLLDVDVERVKAAIEVLKSHYADEMRGIQIIEVNQSVQLASKREVADVVEKLFKTDKKRGLSGGLLEVLAIVAYRQPVTKLEIEAIRGVKSDRALQALSALDFIYVSGKLEQIGRPNLYSTTTHFLKKFGLRNLRELPPIESFDRLQMAMIDEEIKIIDD